MDLRPSSLNSSFNYAFTYDVFLSFRGSDTRYGFTGNLYKNLRNRGIRTFIDDRELQGGDKIKPSLLKAIEESRIAIPVFSINYASSSFCLDELVNIMKRKDIMLVVPIFYNVDPSDVRHQKGSYRDALTEHEKKFKANKEKLEEWKMALHQAANLSGYHFKDGNRYEYKFIEKIIKLVSSKINRTLLYVADYPVGLESQIQEIKKLMDARPDKGANMVGIYGPGGMGKTTLALAIYNLIADQFDSSCFLRGVRENSKKCGLQHLQSILLQKICGEREMNLASFNEGIPILEHRLGRKKVLLVLDDVDEIKLLEAIFGRLDRFGPSITIIITTRNKQVLAYHNIEKTFEVKGLNNEDALQLLRWKAFGSEQVDPSYLDVLNRAVTYASGLPLALEVIGSELYRNNIEEWDSAINKYARIPINDILKVLKISFDALDDEEKNVFLDIACCFKGYGLEEVNKILYAHHGQNMKRHIRVLVDKSLIKIVGSYNSHVTLHDLIEEMGKEIVRQESPKELEERSRLWFHKDVVKVLEHNKGSNKIEIIFLRFPFSKEEEKEEEKEKVEWHKDAFKKMKSLKTLIIKNGHFSQGPSYLPSTLRVLEWNKYPSENLPSGPNKLVICILPNSRISSLNLIGRKEFVSLTNLNFNFCKHLTQIPDVSCLKSLEILSFRDCKNLDTIHSSVGSLMKLKILDAFGCHKLTSFPPLEMASLEKLNLCHCTSLESFPEILVEMKKMSDLELIDTPMMKEFPRSCQNLKLFWLHLEATDNSDWEVSSSLIEHLLTMPGLLEIDFEGIGGWVMPKEDEGDKKVSSSEANAINLDNCKLNEFLIVAPTLFPKLEMLGLWGLNLLTIPECIKECHSLWKLELLECTLQEIRGIPPNLGTFEAIDCSFLTASCGNMLLKQEVHEAGNTRFIVPEARIPEWFEHRSEGTSLSFWFCNKIPRLLLCFVLPMCKQMSDPYFCRLFINGIDSTVPSMSSIHIVPGHTTLCDLEMLVFSQNISLLENEWNHAEVIFVDLFKNPNPGLIVQSGIHVLKQESSMEDILFPSPCRKKKLEHYLGSSKSQNHRLLKKHRLMDMEVVETQIVS